jgi:phage anti-repressor protein
MISSLEMYQSFGRDMNKYYLWVNRYIIQNASLDNPRDYFVFRKAIRGYKGCKTEFYISISLAKALCVMERTKVSKLVRHYIEDNIERNPIARK